MAFQTDTEFIKYFLSNIPTTLIHEIGHAIQGTDHIGSSHCLTKIKLNNSNYLEFDEMSLEIYKTCINMGLFSKYITQIKKSIG